MTALEQHISARESFVPWRAILLSVKWGATALGLLLLSLAALGFFAGFTTYSDVSAPAAALAVEIPDWITRTFVPAAATEAGRASAVFLLIVFTLSACAISAARDFRVHALCALMILAATIITAAQHSAIFSARIATTLQIGAVILAGLLSLAILIDLYRKPVTILETRDFGRLGMKAAFIYWVLVFVLCFFQYLAGSASPIAGREGSDGVIVFIFLAALFLFVSLFLFASFLAYCHLIFWRGAFGSEYLADTNVARLIADPLPGITSGAADPASGAAMASLILMTWIGLSISCLAGAVGNWRFLCLHALAIGAVILIALLTADLTALGSGLAGLFDFSGPPAR